MTAIHAVNGRDRAALGLNLRDSAGRARPTRRRVTCDDSWIFIREARREGFYSWRTARFRLEIDWLMQIIVRDNNVDQALRALKKKLQREGVYREMKLRRHYEKPSEKRAREKAAAVRRARKLERKRAERDGVR
mgnify:CR=1 FL=1